MEELIARYYHHLTSEDFGSCDHGLARSVAELDKEMENVILNQLKNYNINLSTLADKLLEDGLKSFVQSYDDMLQGLQTKEDSYL